MAVFPIRYSERTPTPNYSIPKARLDLDTGAQESISAMNAGAQRLAAGMQDLGEKAFAVSQKIKHAEDVMEVSSKELDIKNSWNSEYEALQKTNDPEARAQIHQKATQDRQAIVNGIKSKNAREATQQRLNDFAPQFDMHFANMDREMRVKAAHDKFKFTGQQLLANGDLSSYYAMLDEGKKTGLIGEEEYSFYKANAEKDSFFARARGLVGTRPDTAMAMVNFDDATLTDDQRKQKEEIFADAARQYKFQVDQFKENLAGQQNQLDQQASKGQISPSEISKSVQAMSSQIYASNLPETDKMELNKKLLAWAKGDGQIDYQRLLYLQQRLDSAQRTGIVDPTIKSEINAAQVDGAFGPLGKGGEKNYASMLRRLDSIKMDSRLDAIKGILSQYDQENKFDPQSCFLFHQAVNNWLIENPEKDARDTFIRVNEIKATYETMKPDQLDMMMQGTTVQPTLPRPKTLQEKALLPSGTRYIDPNGVERIKQ